MKATLFLFAKCLLTALIFYVLLQKVDWVLARELFSRLSWPYTLASLVSLTLANLTLAYRARIIFKALGHALPLKDLLNQVMIGYAFNQALPSSVGGDVYRAILLERQGVRWRDTLTGLVVDRLFGILVLSLFCLVFIPLNWGILSSSPEGLLMGLILAGLLGGVILLIFAWKGQGLLAKIPGGGHILNFSKDFYRLLFSKFSGPLIAYAILGMMVYILPFYLTALDLNIPVPFTAMMAAGSIVVFVSALPLSFAGWGLREGAMVICLGALNVMPTKALSVSVIYGLLSLAAAIPGLLCWFVYKMPSKDTKR